jgi:hypothetical protein
MPPTCPATTAAPEPSPLALAQATDHQRAVFAKQRNSEANP